MQADCIVGSHGIGLELASKLVKFGVRVVIVDINGLPESLKRSPLLTFYQGDVSDLGFIQKMYKDLEKLRLFPTILVNNAAIQNGCKTLEQLDYKAIEKYFECTVRVFWQIHS